MNERLLFLLVLLLIDDLGRTEPTDCQPASTSSAPR